MQEIWVSIPKSFQNTGFFNSDSGIPFKWSFELVIGKLIAKKEKIKDKYLNNIEKFIAKVNRRIDHAMKDEKHKIDVNIGFYNHLRTLMTVDKGQYLNMDSKSRLQYAEKWFDSKDKDVRLLISRTEEHHKSLLKDIDRQIIYYRRELDLINKEAQMIKGKGFSRRWNTFTINRKKKRVERASDL